MKVFLTPVTVLDFHNSFFLQMEVFVSLCEAFTTSYSKLNQRQIIFTGNPRVHMVPYFLMLVHMIPNFLNVGTTGFFLTY